MGNLNNDLKDLKELFGLKTSKHLKENCSIAMAINRKIGKTKVLHSYRLQTMNCLTLMALISMERIQF